ncbi:MAG: rod shape-determining protein [Selenomonadaceae bacterium]|nr:rod shape-determining protein [Selenomonadaceae bacterium]
MADSYFPMLPKVNEDISKVLKDQAGIWKETDINFLQGLANSLDCGDSIKDMGSVDSIPDIWARPLLFKMALFDLEPNKQLVTGLHDKVKGEWRALLAMFALKDFKQLDLRAEHVNLLENHSELAKILKSLAPNDSLTGNKSAWLTDIYIIYFNGSPIAMTSPTTLAAPAADYEQTFDGKIFTPFSSDNKILTDPIKFLSPAELSALKIWLQNLYTKIQSLNIKANEISNSVLKCIADYQYDVAAAQIDDENFDLVPSNLNLHVGTARLLDDTVKGREPRFEDSAVRLINDKKNLLLVSPDFVRDFAKFEGVNPAKLVVWQGISANDITNDKLSSDYKKIGRTVLKNTEFRRPEDFFYEKMAVTEPANAFPNSPKLQGADSLSDKDLTPILPVKRELLEIFTPEEISDRISVSDDKNNFYVHFIFPLSGVDGKGTNFRYTKAYPKQNLIYIDQEVPVIEIYPNFRRSDWNTYFLYYENYRAQSDDDNLAPDIYFVQPFNSKIRENFLQNRFTTKLDNFPQVLIVTYNPPLHSNKKPHEIGAILLNKPKNIERNTDLSWKIGVDFGTSSTMVFFSENNNSPRPLNFSPHLFQITASGGARTQTYRHFIPSQIPNRLDGSFLSIFHILNVENVKNIRPLQDGHVFLLSSENVRVFEQFAGHIDANLKWQDDDRQRRKTAAYIKQICLQAAVEAFSNGVNNIQWNFSYPTAFSQAQKVSFQEICRESVNNTPNFYSESKAAAYHFNNLDGKAGNLAQGAICVDIGAGTTDISIISGNSPRIVYHTSIKYAARQMFKPLYDNFELFADEKIISGKLNDETQRQAVIDADMREHSDKYLADLKFKTGNEQIKSVLQTAQVAAAGLFHYLGELIRILHDYGHYREEKIPHVFVGGNGARIFHWLTGGTDINGNIYLNVLENIFCAASGLENYKKFCLHLSPQPKIEVAAGMIVDKPANDVEFFDEERINREMFGDADDFIYSAVLAGADFNQGGETQSASSFISAHDIFEGITINSLREFKNFVERFNNSQKLWAEGINFDEEELIRDTNNFYADKKGRDIKKMSVEPVFIAELKIFLGNGEQKATRKTISAEKKSPSAEISIGEKFVNDFNALEKLSGFSARQAREKFLRRYKVRGLNCANVEERMNNPKTAPTFSESASIAGSDFWACEIDENLFAVVPNIKTYTENHHAERAFGLVFESNYERGTYSRLRVERAAVLEFGDDNWQLKSSGKIVLNR